MFAAGKPLMMNSLQSTTSREGGSGKLLPVIASSWGNSTVIGHTKQEISGVVTEPPLKSQAGHSAHSNPSEIRNTWYCKPDLS